MKLQTTFLCVLAVGQGAVLSLVIPHVPRDIQDFELPRVQARQLGSKQRFLPKRSPETARRISKRIFPWDPVSDPAPGDSWDILSGTEPSYGHFFAVAPPIAPHNAPPRRDSGYSSSPESPLDHSSPSESSLVLPDYDEHLAPSTYSTDTQNKSWEAGYPVASRYTGEKGYDFHPRAIPPRFENQSDLDRWHASRYDTFGSHLRGYDKAPARFNTRQEEEKAIRIKADTMKLWDLYQNNKGPGDSEYKPRGFGFDSGSASGSTSYDPSSKRTNLQLGSPVVSSFEQDRRDRNAADDAKRKAILANKAEAVNVKKERD
ncbi:hypothetical protein BJ508DRAFT_373309 [Ascobolus immersus RN42]|uniref:Uncharacterized protein n=1 Tax=Ascobolus immersus RN42 TaxID=1160509 RepID=A0A3N4ILW9_ASCIM|nr:hypothetical protein BJ508DRAFT_373309 [Ascobolus immersus RN42]